MTESRDGRGYIDEAAPAPAAVPDGAYESGSSIEEDVTEESLAESESEEEEWDAQGEDWDLATGGGFATDWADQTLPSSTIGCDSKQWGPQWEPCCPREIKLEPAGWHSILKRHLIHTIRTRATGRPWSRCSTRGRGWY